MFIAAFAPETKKLIAESTARHSRGGQHDTIRCGQAVKPPGGRHFPGTLA